MQICSKDYFEILRNERGQEVHEGHIISSSKKNFGFGKMSYYWPNLGPEMTDSCNFKSPQKILLKFCTVKVENRYMKILYQWFFQKNLIYGKMGQFGHNLAQKMMYPYNSESVFRNLLKVSTVKRTRVHKGYIVSFS